MTLLYYNPVVLEHETGSHPENAGRVIPFSKHLEQLGSRVGRPQWDAVSIDRLRYIHTDDHIKAMERTQTAEPGYIERDTVVSPRSYDVARVAAGAVCDAVERVVGGEDTTAFCVVRPPGHHAVPGGPMGFCLFNSIAVGAQVARKELGLDRVLIVDFDVHHGNGTQDMFWEDGSVGFLSMHRAPFYPGTGDASETGSGPGLGMTVNLPIAFGTSRQEQLSQFAGALESFANKVKPQLILLSAGFDSHKDDPVGSLGLESEDFETLTHSVMEAARAHCAGKLVSVLEGGYNPAALKECATIHVSKLLETES